MVNTTNINASTLRKIKGKVELYRGSTLLTTFMPDAELQEITVARTGEHGKFFGFGVCQKLTVKFVGAYVINKGDALKTHFNADSSNSYTRVCPEFYVKEAVYDEKADITTLTAYDALDAAIAKTVNDLMLEVPYTIGDVCSAIATNLGLSGVSLINIASSVNTSYAEGANFSGSENLRTALNAIAEAIQAIYYVDHNNELVFKTLDKDGAVQQVISKNNYFELKTAAPVAITNIMSVTELGDNLSGTDNSGVIQYVRDNPFWDTRTDLDTVLQAAIDNISGLTITPYNIKWRGSYLTEIGDKVSFEAKDGSFIESYLLDDSFTYTGGLTQTCSWEYNPDTDRVTAATPITVGDKLNQTFAKVDRVNRQISLVASETEANKNAISTLTINTDSIAASVSQIESNVNESLDNMNSDINSLRQEVSTMMTEADFTVKITEELAKGTNTVITETGYRFDKDGLMVSKSGSEMSTQITDDGMKVYKDSNAVLSATSTGVDAVNLKASTYLIIGTNSRFEDYAGNRTGCFWIGG